MGTKLGREYEQHEVHPVSNEIYKHYDHLYKFGAYKLNDHQLLRDLIQDTFLTALRNWQKFEKRSSELTWLTAILKYKIYREYRRKAALTSSNNLPGENDFSHQKDQLEIDRIEDPEIDESVDMDNVFDNMTSNYLQPDERVEAKELTRNLASFISNLPEKWQAVYNMRFINEDSTEEICNKLNISIANYWVITHRLKEAVKKWYLTNYAQI